MPSTSAVWRAVATSTVMPHTGSTAVAGAGSGGRGRSASAASSTRAPLGSSCTISARIDSATSGGVRAPRSRPAGFRIVRTPGTPRLRARRAPSRHACATRPGRRTAAALQNRRRAPPRRSAPARRRPRPGRIRRPGERIERVEIDHLHAERRRLRLDVAPLAASTTRDDLVVHAARQPRQRVGDRRRADDDEAAAPARTVRRTRPRLLPTRRSSGPRHARRSSRRLARIGPNRHQAAVRARSDSSACRRTISREQAPPTNPSMRPSANTIARSPRCADTGARRATTVATANDCPSRCSAATRSKTSDHAILSVPRFAPASASPDGLQRLEPPASCP